MKYSWEALKNNNKSIVKRGNKNPNWKGDKVGYVALHNWVKRRIGITKICKSCGCNNKRLDLANISGNYLRDLNDWVWLCKPCHAVLDRFDNRIKGSNNPQWKGGVSFVVEKECLICRKKILVKKWVSTCSRSCAAKMVQQRKRTVALTSAR
jgi:hypothetical protein